MCLGGSTAGLLTLSCEELTCADLLTCEGGAGAPNESGGSAGNGSTGGRNSGGSGGSGGRSSAASGGQGGGPSGGTGGSETAGEPGLALTAPAVVRVRQGEKVRVPIRVERKGGIEGELTVSAIDLPAGIVADPAILLEGEDEVAFDLAAKAAAEQTHGRTLHLRVTGPDGLKDEVRVRLVVAGAPGSLDESFGGGGFLKVSASLSAVTIAPDESIWAAGEEGSGGPLRVYHFEHDGSPNWNVETRARYSRTLSSQGERVFVRVSGLDQENGDYLMAFGLEGLVDGAFGDEGMILLGMNMLSVDIPVQLLPDGGGLAMNAERTVRFGPDGRELSDFKFFYEPATIMDRVTASAIDSKGRVLVSWRTNVSERYFLHRARAEGRLDTSFGQGGMAESWSGVPSEAVGQTMEAERILVRPDDSSILFATSAPNVERTGNEIALLSFSSKGEFDSDFGVQGKVIVGNSFTPLGAFRATSGDVIVGYIPGYTGEPRLARYSDRGARDEEFGEDGEINLTHIFPTGDSLTRYPDFTYDSATGRVVVVISSSASAYLASYWL